MLFPSVHAGVITDAKPVAGVLHSAFFSLLEAVSIIMVIAFVISGAMMLFAGGNPKLLEKSKRAFSYSCGGVLLCLGLYVILNFIIEMLGA